MTETLEGDAKAPAGQSYKQFMTEIVGHVLMHHCIRLHHFGSNKAELVESLCLFCSFVSLSTPM